MRQPHGDPYLKLLDFGLAKRALEGTRHTPQTRTARLEKQGFAVAVHRVEGSRKGRGRRHVIWIACRR
ncbi:MAG: hypothetical protein HYY06_12470 [Deltaproteobacteria bacterium]|nr:hypothetical protein [Deltaproteobacteria bacterium]